MVLAATDLIAIPLTAVAVLTTMAGGLLAMRMAHSLPTAIALSGGVVVAVALFDVLPEAIELLPDDPRIVVALVGAGFLTFFLTERVLVLHHRDKPADVRAHHQVGTAGALGLSAHSFADGLNTVSFVLNQSQDRGHALRWLTIDAVAPLFGATVGVLIKVSDATLGHLLSFYAGFFLYMGATDLLPRGP
jgi:zinc transporter ZupT